MKIKNLNEKSISDAIDELKNQGAEVIVASRAFGVDSIKDELLVQKVAEEKA